MVLIEKHYRGYLNRTIADTFWKEVSALKVPTEMPPVIQSDRFVLAHVQFSDLFVLSVIDDEMPALMAIDMMFRCLDIFKQYFSTVNADTLRKHFAIVYQLMDEVCCAEYHIMFSVC
jgi:AP-3 complex subunit mu